MLTRAAGRAALKPAPTRQAKAVVHYLLTQVSLNFVAIPESEINTACERYNLERETWERQEHAFGLMKKVYLKRARIRGEQPIMTKPAWASEPASDAEDEYG